MVLFAIYPVNSLWPSLLGLSVYWASTNGPQQSLKRKPLKFIIDLKGRETRIKITISAKDPLHKINLIDPALFVARVGILLDFANFGKTNLSRRLM